MKYKILAFFLTFLSIPIFTCLSFDNSKLSGNINVWWIYEQNENGAKQAVTKDDAVDIASGFIIKQARLTYDYNNNPFSAKAQVRFEEKVALLDCFISWQPSPLAQIYVGQMKIPSTYEVLMPDERLDFISRSALSKIITDWLLSRPPYYSPFYGNRSDYRDMGIGIKGNYNDLASYFLMVSNGLGANLAIGSEESKEFILSNNLGDYFYGARLELSPTNLIKLGGHYSLNKHDNVLYNDGKLVLDFNRYSWSVDASFAISFLQFVGMYGKGEIEDDYFHANLTSLGYSGWEAKLLADIIKNKLQIGLRFDRYTEDRFNGVITDYNNTTLGINYMPTKDLRLQLNYVNKTTDSNANPDFDNDILFLNFQCFFDTK